MTRSLCDLVEVGIVMQAGAATTGHAISISCWQIESWHIAVTVIKPISRARRFGVMAVDHAAISILAIVLRMP